MLDEDQKQAFNLSSGHNLVITGQGGTGKTFLIKQIITEQRQRQRNVAIVCSTGIASTHYGNLGAKTLHKWAGIEDGRHLNEVIVHLVKTDERFHHVKHNVENTELLIIDEISMVSAKTLGQVENLCRLIRGNNAFFGGLQVILAGDFYQLPPVANELIGDPGNHCFKLPWFHECFPHKVTLNIIHRQSETLLIKCVNELEIGEPTEESIAFLKSLDRPLPNENQCEPVHLFARNYDVDIFNYEKMQNLPGDLKLYKAKDEGSEHYLRKFLAPKNLGLKVGCPVMLVKNLSDLLVNGLCGTISKLDSDSVDIRFLIKEKFTTVTVKHMVFTTFDPVDNIIIAKRTQLPLKLAYAMTVHKSQGMSLRNVIVDCDKCFQPGQIGVAVGRAVQIDGLRVLNFKKNVCRKHPRHVSEFYESCNIGVLRDDFTCCRETKYKYIDENSDDDDCDDDNDEKHEQFDSGSEFSESEIEKLDNLDTFIEQHILSDEESLSPTKAALDSVFEEFVGTQLENDMNSFKQNILQKFNIFDDWYQSQSSVIEDIGLNCLPEGEKTYSPKQQSDFFVKFHKYLNSEEYINSSVALLKAYGIQDSGPQYQFLTTVLFYLEKKFFVDFSEHLELKIPEPFKLISFDNLLSSAKGKIRYISGYVLAKIKHKLSIKIRNSLFAEGLEIYLNKLQNQMTILNSLCTTYEELKDSCTDPESLQEVKRKQNERESLTNVTDLIFDFFTKLELLCRDMLSHCNLVDYGKVLYKCVLDELVKDSELFELWVETLTKNYEVNYNSSDNDDNVDSMLNPVLTSCENYLDLYKEVVELFLKVSYSQFRRDFLTFLKIEKGKALRKKVMEKTKKTLKTFSMQNLKDDTSKDKISSHLRLKSEIMQNDQFLLEKTFTKKDLLLLCQTYNVKMASQKRKSDINSELVKAISQADLIPCPTFIQTSSVVLKQSNQPTDTSVTSEIIDSTKTHTYDDDIPGPSNMPSPPPASAPTSSLASGPPPAKKQTGKKSTKRKSTRGKKGKAKGRKKDASETISESDEHCAICNGIECEGEDWINCDECHLWYHRNCVNINDEEWNCLTVDDDAYKCPLCQ